MIIKINAKRLDSFLSRLLGLIGQNTFQPVYFTTRWGVHTFGMKAAIDVYILNSNKKVVRVKKKLSPGSVFFWNPNFFNVLETPVDYKKINLGDHIKTNFF